MRVACRRSLSILALFGALTAAQTASVATARAAEPAGKAPAVTTYPQIVRLNYVQGDVRVARGKEAEKLLEQEPGAATGWEQAAVNLPLATGYSLATGTGRAEIEFEDATVVYLGENSVLTFNQISTTSGVPTTELALLTGTATMNAQSMLPGESFRIFTPSDSLTVLYPKKAYLRINSYLDAIAVTPQKDVPWFAPAEQRAGKTVSVHNGRAVATPEMDAAAMAEWDMWVQERVAARDVKMASAMKDAGLTEPIPGLEEMSGQGKFFACEPYGMCWEPNEGWAGDKAEVAQVEAQPGPASGSASAQADTQPAAPVERAAPSDDQASAASAPTASGATKDSGAPQASGASGQSKAEAYLASHPGATLLTEDYTFPCSEFAERDLIAVDPVTGKETIVASEFATDGYPYFAGWPYTAGVPHRMNRALRLSGSLWGFDEFNGFNGYEPWDWGVCHAGSWIRWRHHYVWVVGTKRHHHRPIRWVKRGREVGYVPIHPKDVAGKPPINLKDGVFKPTKKGDSIKVERVNFKEGKPVELMKMNEAPKEFRKPVLQTLERAETPHAMAYSASHAGQQMRGTATASLPIAKGTSKTGSTTEKGVATASLPIAKGTAKTGPTVEAGLAMKQAGTPITFDRKQQSFSVARPVIENGRQSMVVQTLGGGWNGSAVARGTTSYGGAQTRTGTSNGGGTSRSYSPAPSNNGGSGSYSRPSAPAPSYSPPARSYSPPAQSYSPPAQTHSAPAPSNNGGGAPSGGGGAAHR
jgi:hypothetical protein